MFRDVLTQLLSRLQGAEWAVVMGLDGVMLDSCGGPARASVEAAAAEYALFLRACQHVVSQTAAGEFQTLVLLTDRGKVILQALTPEYFLMVGLSKSGISGKALYEISRSRSALERELVL